MKKHLTGAFAFTTMAVLLLLPVAAAQDRSASFQKALDEARAGFRSPGASAAIAQNGRIAWSSGSGVADVENDVPARPNTVYRTASISKTFAAVAVMQLVEQGKVSLDDRIDKYVPSFPNPAGVTIRHILGHVSGIRHYRGGENPMPTRFETLTEAIRIFKDDPLEFSPGTRYLYSSYAFNLLAGVIEKASGVSYEAYMQERLWTPAGMKETYLEHAGAVVKNRSRQYVREGNRFANAPYADLSIKWAGGGKISTVEDLARWALALDEGKFLRKESMEQMYVAGTLTDGKRTGYGLGWFVSTDDQGRRWVAHSGGATGGTTYLLRRPEDRIAVVIMTNVEGAPGLAAASHNLARIAMSGSSGTK